MSVEIDYILIEEILSELAGLELFCVVASFELPVLFLSDVASDLLRHLSNDDSME